MLEVWECILRVLILALTTRKKCGVWGCNGTGPPTSSPNSVHNVMSCHDVTLETISRSSLPTSP